MRTLTTTLFCTCLITPVAAIRYVTSHHSIYPKTDVRRLTRTEQNLTTFGSVLFSSERLRPVGRQQERTEPTEQNERSELCPVDVVTRTEPHYVRLCSCNSLAPRRSTGPGPKNREQNERSEFCSVRHRPSSSSFVVVLLLIVVVVVVIPGTLDPGNP